MINRRQLIQSASAVGLTMPAIVRAQAPYKSEYRLSMSAEVGSAWHTGSENFASLTRERTAGRINIKVFPSSSLVQGQPSQELNALRQGGIDALTGPGAVWSTTVKDLAAFLLPYLIPNTKAMDAVLASDALNKDFYDIFRKAGLEPLASAEYGFVQLMNSKRRIAKPADIRGLKMRVTASPMQTEVMTEVGANPTSMSFGDATAALSTGAIDGLTITLEQLMAYKAYNLGLKYVTRWNCYSELTHFLIAAPIWKSWTPQDQAIVRASAKDAASALTRLVREGPANNDENLRKLGIDVYTPTAAEMAEWQIALRRVAARWKAQTNPPLISKIEEAVARSQRA